MKIRYILIASALCFISGVFAVNRNAATAQQLAQAILAADNANQPTNTLKTNLANYVKDHMGASITVFMAAAYQRAQAATPVSTQGEIYHTAQAACVSRTTAVNQAKCVQDYIAAHPVPAAASPSQPAKAAYTLTYTAPHWSADPAGLLLFASLLGVGLSAALLLKRWMF